MNKPLQTAITVVRSWRFALNLVVILLITSWVPLMSKSITIRDEHGYIIHETMVSTPVYRSWRSILRWDPDVSGHLRAAALHFGLCFVVAFGVWYLTLYARREEQALGDNAVGDACANATENGDETPE